MYIKKIQKRNGVTDKVYTYLHLVESIRTPDGPRPKLILNLGNLDLDPSQYQAFAQAVDNPKSKYRKPQLRSKYFHQNDELEKIGR